MIVVRLFKLKLFFLYSVVCTLCNAQLPLVGLHIENRNMSLEKLRPIVRGTCRLECAKSVALHILAVLYIKLTPSKTI